jgi:hypothetical protein
LLQFLSAPNVLHDLHGIEDAIGAKPSWASGVIERLGSDDLRRVTYLAALERGFLDGFLDRVVVEPFIRLANLLTQIDERLCDAVISARVELAATDEGRDE